MGGTILATDSVAKVSRKGRPNYPIGFKRDLAMQACEPDVSVAKLALKHGINANMLFKWRRQYRAGQFGVAEKYEVAESVTLLPVVTGTISKPKPVMTAVGSMIEIVVGEIVVRVRGGANRILLSTVLDCLAQRR